MRINQFLARSGVASRRKAEEIIRSGHVLLNGKAITNLATEIDPTKDTVIIEGIKIELKEKTYLLFNKPPGYTVTRSDKHAKHSVFELLPSDPSLFAIGRLDRDTEGLLIVTNDGQFGQNIIHPSKKIEKCYDVMLKNVFTEDDKKRLISGVTLEDGPARFTRVNILSPKFIEVGIEEGRNRIIRRMLAVIGNEVIGLTRTKIGDISLDVKPGEYRALTEKEVAPYA